MDKITIAIVVIFSIIFLSYKYNEYTEKKKKRDSTTWPVEYQQCPDYWVQDGSKCWNKHNLGRRHYHERTSDFPGLNQAIDFSRGQFSGEDGMMNKCKWAKKHNVSWEGVDNLAGCH